MTSSTHQRTRSFAGELPRSAAGISLLRKAESTGRMGKEGLSVTRSKLTVIPFDEIRTFIETFPQGLEQPNVCVPDLLGTNQKVMRLNAWVVKGSIKGPNEHQ